MLLLMGIYQLLLAKTAMHKFKRFYLLLSLILPLAVPFIELESEDPNISAIAVNEKLTARLIPEIPDFATPSLPPVENDSAAMVTPAPQAPEVTPFDYQPWLVALYGVVALMLLIRYSLSIFTILKKARSAQSIRFQGSRVSILDQKIVPHNFLHLIFISRKDYEDTTACKRLLTHELSHARQFHTLDILLLEFLRILFWFNPLYIFWSRAIRANHEYLADAAVLNEFSDVNTYKKLLLGFAGHKLTGPKLASPSNYSLTKKRFIMMTKRISKSASALRLAIITPLLIFTAVAMTLKTSIPNTPSEEIVKQTVVSNQEEIHPSFEGAKPSIFPIAEKDNPEFVLHFDATMHRGTDREYNRTGVAYRAALGTAVRAAGDGIVITSEKNAKRGNYVVIKHSDEYQTLYASLNELMVREGQEVKRGTTIGTVGKSMENSNIHLHYEVIKNGKPIDPQEYYLLKKTPTFLRDINRINLSIRGFEVAKKHGLKQPFRTAHFPDSWKYKGVFYDKNKVVLTQNGSDEVRTLEMSKLTTQQKEALSELQSDLRAIMKTPLRPEITEEWLDPDKYLVIIDGELIENAKLADFNTDHVAFYWKAKLRKNDPTKPLYRIDILSEDGYQKLMKQDEDRILKLEKANKALLDQIVD